MNTKTMKHSPLCCDGVIFDVDGTLWDSTPVVVRAYNEIIEKELGYRLTAADLQANFGKPMLEIGRTLMKGLSEEKNREMIQRITKRQDELLAQDPPSPYPGVPEVMKKLSEQYPVSIVSNCQAGYIERFLQATGTADFVALHFCPDDTGLLKAGNIKLVVQKLGLQDPVYIGDTAMDETACREAGVRFIFAAYGFGKAENPDAVIHSPKELLPLLE